MTHVTGGGKQGVFTMTAAIDLTDEQYHIVEESAAGVCNISSDDNAGAATMVGILQNKPDSGQAARVADSGESKVKAGGSITAGTWLTCGGSGLAAAATSGDLVFGRAQEAASSEQYLRVRLMVPFRLGGAV